MVVVDTTVDFHFLVKFHYPAEVSKVGKGLQQPLDEDYNDGIVCAVEGQTGRILYADLTGALELKTTGMKAQKLRKVLEDRYIEREGLTVKEMKKALEQWVSCKQESQQNSAYSIDLFHLTSPQQSHLVNRSLHRSHVCMCLVLEGPSTRSVSSTT